MKAKCQQNICFAPMLKISGLRLSAISFIPWLLIFNGFSQFTYGQLRGPSPSGQRSSPTSTPAQDGSPGYQSSSVNQPGQNPDSGWQVPSAGYRPSGRLVGSNLQEPEPTPSPTVPDQVENRLEETRNASGTDAANASTEKGKEPTAGEQSLSSVSVENVEARRQQLDANTEISEEDKKTFGQLYEGILAELKALAENDRLAAEFASRADAAPTQVEEAKRNKESQTEAVGFSQTAVARATAQELQDARQRLQSSLQAASTRRTELKALIPTRETRKKEIVKLIADTKAQIEKGSTEAPKTNGSENPELVEANAWLATVKRQNLVAKLRKLEAEQRAIDTESELLPIQEELLANEEKQLQKQLDQVSEELARRRERVVLEYQAKLQGILQQSDESLKPYGEVLSKRIAEWLKLAGKSLEVRREAEASKNRKQLWSDRYNNLSTRLDNKESDEVGNVNSLVGLMLRRQKNELPNARSLKTQLREYQEQMVKAETLIIEIDDFDTRIEALDQGDETPESFISALIMGPSAAISTDQLPTFKRLVALEKEINAGFRSDASTYFDSLFDIASLKGEMIALVRRYNTFIDQHVLWIRSSEPINLPEFQYVSPGLRWLIDRDHWRAVLVTLVNDFRAHPVMWILATALIIALQLNVPSIRRSSLKTCQKAGRTTETRFRSTLEVIGLCLLIAAPLPLILAGLGWRLLANSQPQTFCYAISYGFLVSGRYFYALEVIRQIMRADGLCEKLFSWDSGTTKLVRGNVRWLIDFGIPLIFVAAIYSNYAEEHWENTIGRFAFFLLMISVAIFLALVLRPRTGLLRNYISNKQGGWIDRLRYVWFGASVLTPIILIFLSGAGYHFTSQRLAMLLYTTIITATGLVIVYAALARWSMLGRRQLIMTQAKQRLLDAQKREPGESSGLPPTAPEKSDFADFNAQTLRLISSGTVVAGLVCLLYIWRDILPAVNVLSSVDLWTVKDGDGGVSVVTLANLLAAIPIVAMTFVAARNLPGLLEIALLQHLPIENAVRYAISTLSRYAILMLGVAFTFNSLGVRWGSIQWLIAALGVGLGFGLQEIFANLVSGIILLFEQPIRVNDVITLDSVTGTVSKIRMRATTIVNWDRQELIIPNKDLITGRLLNWTLSDSTNRMMLTVGIAYGSDPEHACQLLSDICKSHPNVLTDPGPTAYFEEFADSTLNLNVRFFLAKLDQRLETRHQLLSLINSKFLQEHIEIAFPQRDLHIRSLPEAIVQKFSGKAA